MGSAKDTAYLQSATTVSIMILFFHDKSGVFREPFAKSLLGEGTSRIHKEKDVIQLNLSKFKAALMKHFLNVLHGYLIAI